MAYRPRRKATLLGALSLAALGAAAVATSCVSPHAGPPNVLLIVIDTCRGDRCGFGGYEGGTTPALDAFGRDAVTFTDAWSPACWTAPGHASLFTGLRPPRHRLFAGSRTRLDDSADTLAELLTQGGYDTAAFSNNPVVSASTNLIQGFAHFDPVYDTVGAAIPSSAPTHDHVLAWLDQRKTPDKPWFVFVNHMEPHLPYQPVTSIRDRRAGRNVPAAELDWAERFGPPLCLVQGLGVQTVTSAQRDLLSTLYDGEIETVDREIGRLLATLRTRGVLDNLMVVVTADHGENIGDHGLYDHRMSLNRSLCHIPLIVRLPGVFDGGRTVSTVARLEDVLPTVLEACGRPVPQGLDGETLTGAVEGRVSRGTHGSLERMEASLRRDYPALDTRRLGIAIRSAYDGRHHLIRYSDGRVELFDLTADPGEQDDIAATAPDVVARLTPLCDPF